MQIVVNETNRYFSQINEALGPFAPNSCMQRWKDTNLREMYEFLALVLQMPHNVKHRVRDYWARDEVLVSPLFGKYMTRDRFAYISRFLHFTDNDEKEERKTDRLWKVRDVFEVIRKNLYPISTLPEHLHSTSLSYAETTLNSKKLVSFPLIAHYLSAGPPLPPTPPFTGRPGHTHT